MRILRVLDHFFRGAITTASTKEFSAPEKTPAVVLQVAPPESIIAPGTPRYPPIDSGIAVADPEAIIASQDDLIRQLRRNLGLVDAEFSRRYMGPIYRAAELVNLLPASRDKHHTGAGGLFRFALMMAIRTAQASEGKIFAANESIERRRSTELAWRQAAFLTGLTCELFRPMTDMLVVDEKGIQWSPYVAGLTQWAKEQKSERFFVRWHTREDARSAGNSLSSWAVNAVIGNDILGELHAVKPLIVQTIFGVASGAITTADNNTMAALVNEVRRKTIERDQLVQPLNYGRLTSGAHLEPYFLDTMRTLLRTGVWQVNTKGGRCHYGADGFFVAWKMGATEMLGQLNKSGIEGVPASRDTLAEMMGKAGIIKLASDGSWTHVVHASIGDATFPAIQILMPQSIIGTLEFKPVGHNLRSSQVHKSDPSSSASKLTAASAPKFELPVVAHCPAKSVSPEVDKDGVLSGLVPADQGLATKDEPQAAATSTPAGLSRVMTAMNEPGEGRKIQMPVVSDNPAKDVGAHLSTAVVASKSATNQTNSKANRNAPNGAIAAAEEGDPEDEELIMPKEFMLELGAGNCRELAVLRDKWNKGIDRQYFLRTPDGLGIAYSLLSRMAVPFPRFCEAMEKSGYLQETLVAGKKRRLAPLPFTPKEEVGIVVLTAVARRAQFVLE